MPIITTTAGDRITAPPGATVADLVRATGHAGPVRLNGWELVEEPAACEVPLEMLEEVALLAKKPSPAACRGWAIPLDGGWMTVCASCAEAVPSQYEDGPVAYDGATVHAGDIDGAEPCDVALCDICDHAP